MSAGVRGRRVTHAARIVAAPDSSLAEDSCAPPCAWYAYRPDGAEVLANAGQRRDERGFHGGAVASLLVRHGASVEAAMGCKTVGLSQSTVPESPVLPRRWGCKRGHLLAWTGRGPDPEGGKGSP